MPHIGPRSDLKRVVPALDGVADAVADRHELRILRGLLSPRLGAPVPPGRERVGPLGLASVPVVRTATIRYFAIGLRH